MLFSPPPRPAPLAISVAITSVITAAIRINNLCSNQLAGLITDELDSSWIFAKILIHITAIVIRVITTKISFCFDHSNVCTGFVVVQPMATVTLYEKIGPVST